MGKYADLRAKTRGEAKAPKPQLGDKSFEASFPALWDVMTTNAVKGKPVKTMSVTVFVEGAEVKACLNDREGEEVAFVSSDTFQGLLDALEGGLVNGTLDWRASKGYGGKKK